MNNLEFKIEVCPYGYYLTLVDNVYGFSVYEPTNIAYKLNIPLLLYLNILETNGAIYENNHLLIFNDKNNIENTIRDLEPYIVMRRLQ